LENSSEIENYLIEEGADNELIDEING
jgi:hypothetical protein